MTKREEILILVNKKDRAIGRMGKRKCHRLPGFLHRAFLVMILNSEGKLLLARRSEYKPLWPGIWDGSVASHPKAGETLERAAKRRLIEEVGITSPIKLEKLFKFEYEAFWGEKGVEREICTVFKVRCGERIKVDPNEISDFYWVSLKKWKEELRSYSYKYTPWLSLALGKLFKERDGSF